MARAQSAAYAAYQAGSPKLAAMAKEDFVAQYEREYPSAAKCFLDNFEACVAHLQLPISHRRVTRTPICSSGCFSKSAGVPRSFHTPSVSVPC